MYHNTIYLYNVHIYMFRHLCVIHREFYICTLLRYVFLKLKLLKLQFHDIIKMY